MIYSYPFLIKFETLYTTVRQRYSRSVTLSFFFVKGVVFLIDILFFQEEPYYILLFLKKFDMTVNFVTMTRRETSCI